MSTTNAQKRKLAKKKAREKHIRKMINLRNNQPYVFRLDIEVDGAWVPGVMKYRTWAQVLVHKEVTERKRIEGEEIAAGRVVRLIDEKVFMEIPGSKPKGAAPDKIEDGAKADPNVSASERASAAIEMLSVASVK